MSTILKSYPVFEKNQVLTNIQLNQLVSYLDQQNRLTRVSLIGLGIVCGFDVLCEATDTLTVTKGVGVTSEGFLIQMGDCVFTHYKDYKMPGTVSYPPFEDPNPDIALYELLTGSDIESGDEGVSELKDSFLEGKIVLLYLETFDKDLKSCLGKNCDELGKERIFNRKALLIGKEDLLKVMAATNGGKPDAEYPDKFKIPPLVMPRPLFSPKSFESKTYFGMGVNYLESIFSHFDLIISHINETYNIYQPVLEELYDGNPFASGIVTSQIKNIKKYIQRFLAFQKPIYGVQYFYDFFKDLTLAYNEFREKSFDLSAACCPDMTRFPKHLMLGETCASTTACHTSKYRHEFVESPILNQQQELLNHILHLHKRMVLMLESFDFKRIDNPKKIEFKITPSSEKKGFLSQRTIPHYYNSKLKSQFARLGTLEDAWNYDTYRKCYPSKYPQQLSYDNHKFDNPNENPITTPLGFDLEQFNFFRVEGILAKSIEEARKNLIKHKNTNNLSFDVKAVYFGHLNNNEKLSGPNCAYADLQAAYSIWRNKGLLFFNNLVKTNQNVENVVLNRDIIYESTKGGFAFGEEDSQKERTFKRGKPKEATGAKMNFNFQNFTGMMDESKTVDFHSAAGDVSRINKNLGMMMVKPAMANTAGFESSRDTSIRGLFKDLNNCLLDLIKAMPVDFKEFKMDEWLKHYKCVLRMYIQVMKFIASEAGSLQQMLMMFVVLKIMCILFRVLQFIAIYPYITIRTLYDTVQERIAQLQDSLQFARFLKSNPGMEHKAGLAAGQTFVLVYQMKHEIKDLEGLKKSLRNIFRKKDGKLPEDKLFTGDFEFPNSPDPEQIMKVLNEMTDTVVADFTVPFVCCDDCGNLPHTPLPLDPLATPICGVAQFNSKGKDGKDTLPWDYEMVKIRILNDLYDPAIYQVRLATDPNFGESDFVDGIYDPDPTKTAQIFQYEIDEDLLAEEMKKHDDFFIIDEFEYEIIDTTKNNEVVGSDKISIFIPVVHSVEVQTGNISGTVGIVDDSGKTELLPGINIVLKGTTMGATTDANGFYRINSVPTGSQTLEASFIGYASNEKQIDIAAGENNLDFVLQSGSSFEINYGRIHRAMGIKSGSEDARKVEAYYSTQMSDYQHAVDKLEKGENSDEVTPITKAKASIQYYAGEKDISVVKLNNDYNRRRNELIESWDEASGREKELYSKTLKNLTGAYLDRLAFAQPEKLSRTTKETLKETASIFNSRKEIGMNKTMNAWNKNARGYVTEDYRENIKKELKLR